MRRVGNGRDNHAKPNRVGNRASATPALPALGVCCGDNPEAPRGDAAVGDAQRDASSGLTHECPVGGCVVVAIASVPDPFGIAVDARNVYWTDLGTALGVVVSMPLSGGAQTTLAAGGFDTITLNEGYVYLSATQRVPSGGLPLDATISYSGGLAFDGTNVYWGATGGVNQENGFLVRSQVAGGGITTLVSLGQ
jgi:hypothetical protein